jgi:hypothetical protein
MNDAELIDFVSGFRDGILDGREPYGMCFMICAPLVTLLNMHGVECEMVEGPVTVSDDFANHIWLELDDGRVLDPTASQFNGSQRQALPPVYLGPPTAIHRSRGAFRRP